jgi:hypothetical protein
MDPYFAYFWDQRAPYAVRHDIERRTGTLLDLDSAHTHPLTYTGHWLDRGRIELRLEGSMLNGTLYSLRFDAVADYAERFRNWLRDLAVTDDPRNIEFAAGPRYDELVRIALEFEAKRAAVKEDKSAIDMPSAGTKASSRSRFNGEDGRSARSERARRWRSMPRRRRRSPSCGPLPHKPPETAIWKYIGYQLK